MTATPDPATKDIEPAEIEIAGSRNGDDDFALVVGIDDYPRFRTTRIKRQTEGLLSDRN